MMMITLWLTRCLGAQRRPSSASGCKSPKQHAPYRGTLRKLVYRAVSGPPPPAEP
jgi:hypothetical protein